MTEQTCITTQDKSDNSSGKTQDGIRAEY